MRKNTIMNEYDERQIQIRGDIFKSGFFAALILLLINGFLNSYGIVWAEVFQQNIIIMMMLSTFVGVRLSLRGAYFTMNIPAGTIVGLLVFSTIIMGVSFITHFIDSEPLISKNALTSAGDSLVIFVLFAFNTIVALVQYIRNKKQEKEKNDVIDS